MNPAAAPAPSVLDDEQITVLMGVWSFNGKNFFQENVATFGATAQRIILRASAAVAAQDAEVLRYEAHDLKGLALNFGARALAEAASALEVAARPGRMWKTPPLVDELTPRLTEALTELRGRAAQRRVKA